MNRLERVREEVDRILTCLLCDEDRRCGFVHLYGVSHAATELAYARGLDVELAAVAGMLHDLTNYTEGESSDHGLKSARLAERMLERLALFSPDEVATITHAIPATATRTRSTSRWMSSSRTPTYSSTGSTIHRCRHNPRTQNDAGR